MLTNLQHFRTRTPERTWMENVDPTRRVDDANRKTIATTQKDFRSKKLRRMQRQNLIQRIIHSLMSMVGMTTAA